QMAILRCAVVWDLDGTLVDSEEYHWRSWKETLDREGTHITRQDCLASCGQRNDAIIPRWLGADARGEDIQRVGDAKESRYRELVRLQGLAPLPGAAAWVECLHHDGWRQAIASSAPRANVDAVLDALGLRQWFRQRWGRGRDGGEARSAGLSYRGVACRRGTAFLHCRGRRGCGC